MQMKRLAVITAAGLTVAGGAGAAIAATSGDEGRRAEDTVLKDAAADLNVSPGKLRDALGDARAAQLDRELDRAVKAGELTRRRAEQIKARQRESGRVLGFGHGPGGPRPGFRGGAHRFGGPRGFGGGPLEDVAKALGISREKLFSELREGRTFSQIARAHGKTLDELKSAAAASAKQRLDEAVKDGDLTERQAKDMLDHLEEHLDELGAARRFGPRHGPGGPGGHPGPPGGMRR